MRFYGGGPVGAGNAGIFNNSVIGANTNPLMDPRFKIQGGEPWNPKPLLPGTDTKRYEQQQQFNIPRQLPSAGIGNVGGMLAQAYTLQGDALDMGPREGDYSNMTVIEEPGNEERMREMMLDEYRNRAFPPAQLPANFHNITIT